MRFSCIGDCGVVPEMNNCFESEVFLQVKFMDLVLSDANFRGLGSTVDVAGVDAYVEVTFRQRGVLTALSICMLLL